MKKSRIVVITLLQSLGLAIVAYPVIYLMGYIVDSGSTIPYHWLIVLLADIVVSTILFFIFLKEALKKAKNKRQENEGTEHRETEMLCNTTPHPDPDELNNGDGNAE